MAFGQRWFLRGMEVKWKHVWVSTYSGIYAHVHTLKPKLDHGLASSDTHPDYSELVAKYLDKGIIIIALHFV